MNNQEYDKELFEITRKIQEMLGKLQDKLTKEELIEYSPDITFFWYNLIESSVGQEAVIPYLIQILNQASVLYWNENNLNQQQLDRFDKLRRGSGEGK